MDECLSGVTERDWNADVDGGPLRLAIVGVGGFAVETVLPAVDRADLATVTTLVTGSPASTAPVAEEWGIDHVLTYEEYREGTAADAYDAVYVVTPNARHLEPVETAADLGKHVICEKPLEATVDRGRRLVEACETAGVTLMTAYRMQAEPTMRYLRRKIRAGVVGTPVQVHGGYAYQLLDGTEADADRWRNDPDLAGGGALMDVGVYLVNTSRFLLEADPVAVQATVASPDPGFEGVDEHVAFGLRFPDATTASLTASHGAQADNWMRILGTDGRIHVDSAFSPRQRREVTVRRDGRRVTLGGDAVNEIREEFEYFAACVLGDRSPEPDGRDGLTDLAVMDAVYRAAEAGREVEVDLEV